VSYAKCWATVKRADDTFLRFRGGATPLLQWSRDRMSQATELRGPSGLAGLAAPDPDRYLHGQVIVHDRVQQRGCMAVIEKLTKSN
jgi:hypothetical protein